MPKLLAILLLIGIFSSSPLVLPRSHHHHSINSKKNLCIAAASRETTDAPATGETPALKITELATMKSNNLRWAIHGVATELFHNIFLRTFSRLRARLFASEGGRLDCHRYRQPCKHELAVVTGATGGIGSQIAHDLAFRGYDVVIAARDEARGGALVKEIEGLLKVTPVEDGSESTTKEQELPKVSFVSYHADVPQSALDVASSIKDLGSPISVLCNNAGIMGKSKRLSMKVNCLGPAMLTFALLPLMRESTSQPVIINVGSSAHLRATCVLDEETLASGDSSGSKQSYIGTLSDAADDDLSTYAQSKLALMQFSTLLREWLPRTVYPPIHIFDAHPGLVWTPLLRNHIGDKAVGMLTKTGLANLIYKTSSEGSQAIVSALDCAPSIVTTTQQTYFVNGKPGGYAASESTSLDDSIQLWKCMLASEMEGIIDLPKRWGEP